MTARHPLHRMYRFEVKARQVCPQEKIDKVDIFRFYLENNRNHMYTWWDLYMPRREIVTDFWKQRPAILSIDFDFRALLGPWPCEDAAMNFSDVCLFVADEFSFIRRIVPGRSRRQHVKSLTIRIHVDPQFFRTPSIMEDSKLEALDSMARDFKKLLFRIELQCEGKVLFEYHVHNTVATMRPVVESSTSPETTKSATVCAPEVSWRENKLWTQVCPENVIAIVHRKLRNLMVDELLLPPFLKNDDPISPLSHRPPSLWVISLDTLSLKRRF